MTMVTGPSREIETLILGAPRWGDDKDETAPRAEGKSFFKTCSAGRRSASIGSGPRPIGLLGREQACPDNFQNWRSACAT
jgi:hypothetical protein